MLLFNHLLRFGAAQTVVQVVVVGENPIQPLGQELLGKDTLVQLVVIIHLLMERVQEEAVVHLQQVLEVLMEQDLMEEQD